MRETRWQEMQAERMTTQYGGMFNTDKSDDIRTNSIMQSTLSKPFQPVSEAGPRARASPECLVEPPFARTTVKEASAPVSRLGHQPNHHVTPLD